MSANKKKLDFKLFTRLLSYLMPYSKFAFISLLMTILISLSSAYRPDLIKGIINKFVSGGDIDTYANYFISDVLSPASVKQEILFWAGLILVLLIIESLFQFCIAYFGAIMGQSVVRDVRVKLFKHIQKFKLKYFDRTPNGLVVTRIISDIEAIAEVFSMGLISILGDLVKLAFILVFMFLTNWQISLIILIPIPLLIIATKIFARAMKKSYEKERLQVNKLNTFVQEHISGMSIVQLFNKQKVEHTKFENLNKGHRAAMLQAVNATSLFFPIVELLSSLSIAILLLWSFLLLDFDPTYVRNIAGVVFAFIFWVNQLYRPIRQMADRFNVLQRGMVRAERVFEVLDTHEEIDQSGQLTDVDFNQSLTFKNVWFAYKNEDWVLKGIDLHVEKSKSVAIVGTTGAGKSTIINLLTRFYEYQKGEIFIGDNEIRSIDLSVLRRNVAVVLQDVFLFSDSIMNNITMGDESITKAKVIEASKKVGAHEFISKLPGEYDYNVKERGGVLSVGQKQLIAFIRAYVFNPKILILDEATASVDSESEELIQKATAELQKGRTSIVIAHRLSTIVNSDKIIVLDSGKIIEEGTHSELLEIENGQYKKLYELNFV